MSTKYVEHIQQNPPGRENTRQLRNQGLIAAPPSRCWTTTEVLMVSRRTVEVDREPRSTEKVDAVR
jgi:hypothetical protein